MIFDDDEDSVHTYNNYVYIH